MNDPNLWHPWRIKGTVSVHPYTYAIVPNHPKANKHGYVLFHRITMENSIKRMLNDDEVVHHIDLDPTNNNLSNLKLMTKSEHSSFHQKLQKTTVVCRCPTCDIVFNSTMQRTRLNLPKRKLVFCSKPCLYKFDFSNKKNVRKKLKTNIVTVYKTLPNGKKQSIEEFEREKQIRLEHIESKKRKTSKKEIYCMDCHKPVSNYRSTRCRKCASIVNGLLNRKIQWPAVNELKSMVALLGYVGTGKKLGVSDNAVKNHILRYDR